MFRIYIPFKSLLKGFIVLLILLFLFGSYLTVKAKFFPAEPEIEVTEKHLKIGDSLQVGNIKLTIDSIELTDERNDFAKQDRVLKVSYTIDNQSGEILSHKRMSVVDKKGKELVEYPIIEGNPDYIKAKEVVTMNDYYRLPNDEQEYNLIIDDNAKEKIDVPFKF